MLDLESFSQSECVSVSLAVYHTTWQHCYGQQYCVAVSLRSIALRSYIAIALQFDSCTKQCHYRTILYAALTLRNGPPLPLLCVCARARVCVCLCVCWDVTAFQGRRVFSQSVICQIRKKKKEGKKRSQRD